MTPRQRHIDKQDEKDSDRSRALASLRRDRFFGFAAAGSIRQRLVHAVLADLFHDRVHALTIKALVPGEA